MTGGGGRTGTVALQRHRPVWGLPARLRRRAASGRRRGVPLRRGCQAGTQRSVMEACAIMYVGGFAMFGHHLFAGRLH
eukprot:scaffold1885_cov402-Prasinococcus_capsulatus_cf.AAC.6